MGCNDLVLVLFIETELFIVDCYHEQPSSVIAPSGKQLLFASFFYGYEFLLLFSLK